MIIDLYNLTPCADAQFITFGQFVDMKIINVYNECVTSSVAHAFIMTDASVLHLSCNGWSIPASLVVKTAGGIPEMGTD